MDKEVEIRVALKLLKLLGEPLEAFCKNHEVSYFIGEEAFQSHEVYTESQRTNVALTPQYSS